MTASVLTLSIPPFASSGPWRSHPSAPPIRLEEDWAEPPLHVRLVLPRAKRNRLDRRAQTLAARRPCSVASCTAKSLVMRLVDSELDGSPVVGEAMRATAGW